jgi:transcription-repair coupling factor (superfamily II helicase)
MALPYDIAKVDASPQSLSIAFKPNARVDASRIIELVQKNRTFRFAGNDKLRIDRQISNPLDRAAFIKELLRSLGPPVKARTSHIS